MWRISEVNITVCYTAIWKSYIPTKDGELVVPRNTIIKRLRRFEILYIVEHLILAQTGTTNGIDLPEEFNVAGPKRKEKY